METMVNDLITSRDAHMQTCWINLPIWIRNSIKKAIDEGKWYVDVAKEIGDDGKLGVHKSVMTSLEELGYNVFWANEKSMKTYRISWK